MKKFCSSLRENATNIINFEKKKVLPLAKEKLKLHQDARNCYICGGKNYKSSLKVKKYRKIRDHCHYRGKYRRQCI